MRKLLRSFVPSLACVVLLAGQTARGTDRLRMRVFPAVQRAPAALTVQITITASDDNRLLRVVAESPNFYRASEITIDGQNAAPLNVFRFRDLPTGLYEITGVLIDAHGQQSTAALFARVEPEVGRSR